VNEDLERLGNDHCAFTLRTEPTSVSLRDFHDTLLGSGSVPVATMHRLVDAWAAGS